MSGFFRDVGFGALGNIIIVKMRLKSGNRTFYFRISTEF